MKGYRSAIKINCRFRLDTPLIIRTASDEDYLDLMVERTPDDKLHINGYVWASLVRRAASRVKGLPEIFSSIGDYDGNLGVSPFWFESTVIPLIITDIRPGIRVDRRFGSVSEGALYSEEIVPPGYEIPLEFTIFLKESEAVGDVVGALGRILHVIDGGIENIGGNWSYGFGRLSLIDANYRVIDLTSDSGIGQLWTSQGDEHPLEKVKPETVVPWSKIEVEAKILDGQIMAIHSDMPPMDFKGGAKPLPEYPDHFVFRGFVVESGKPVHRVVIPGKAIRQALLSVPVERRLRTRGDDICLTPADRCTCNRCNSYRKANRNSRSAPDCTCKRCRWFGSTEQGGIIAVTDAVVENEETEYIRRIHLCEHSMQNINLFLEEFLTAGKFRFEIIIDRRDDSSDELVEMITATLEEMEANGSPPGWLRLGASSTCAGQVQVTNKKLIEFGGAR